MRVLLAEPRGFCAGVHRAIAIVQQALEKFGAPIYVRHEIVHNRRVVEDLKNRGALFVDELDEVPDGATVIFSAHGVAKSVQLQAQQRPLRVLDATCPLVAKVHREAERMAKEGRHIILIGHKGHPEVEGTVGQLESGKISVVSSSKEIAQLPNGNHTPIGYITQTTLSVDETLDTVNTLKQRFPDIREPAKEDICYATQNRQNAVKALCQACDLILVLGAPNSSNSNRLREVAERAGIPAKLIESYQDIQPQWLQSVTCLGITAGASAPEILVEELLTALKDLIHKIDLLAICQEDLTFPLPKELQSAVSGILRSNS